MFLENQKKKKKNSKVRDAEFGDGIKIIEKRQVLVFFVV